MMGGATSRSTAADEQGIFGLMGFLADPAACAARLAELQEAAQVSRDAATVLQEKVTAAERVEAETQEKVEAARADFTKAAEKQAEVDVAVNALDTRTAELDERETALKQLGDEVEVTRIQAESFAKVLDERDAALVEVEEAAAALKAEYEGKLANLKALALQ